MGPTSLERPDEHEAGAANELYCWLNYLRECNASCPAFDPRSLKNDEIYPCVVLNNMRSLSVSIGRFVTSAVAYTPAPPPPPVGGR